MQLADAQKMLDVYMAAEVAILSAQHYQIGTRALTRADLGMVQKERKNWQIAVDRLSGNGGMKVKRFVPRDL